MNQEGFNQGFNQGYDQSNSQGNMQTFANGYYMPDWPMKKSGSTWKTPHICFCGAFIILIGLSIWIGVTPHVQSGLFAPISQRKNAKTSAQRCTDFCNTCTRESRNAGSYGDRRTPGIDSQQCKETCRCCGNLESCIIGGGDVGTCYEQFKICKAGPPIFEPMIGSVLICDILGNSIVSLSTRIFTICMSMGNFTGITNPPIGACCSGGNCFNEMIFINF